MCGLYYNSREQNIILSAIKQLFLASRIISAAIFQC